MPPQGPILPRKRTALLQSRHALESVAFQIGVIVAVERNRHRMTQGELAERVGINQIDISAIENGQKVARTVTDKKLDSMFRVLSLPRGLQANFLKWWRDNP